MEPAPVTPDIEAIYPHLRKIDMERPEGVPEEECGAIDVLAGSVQGGFFDGAPVIRFYWKPDEHDLERLNQGFPIEVALFTNVMPMHSLGVL